MSDNRYIIVTGNSLTELVEITNEHTEMGYEPLGGFVVIPQNRYKNKFGQSLLAPKEGQG